MIWVLAWFVAMLFLLGGLALSKVWREFDHLWDETLELRNKIVELTDALNSKEDSWYR